MENTAWGGTGATSPAPSRPPCLPIFSRQAGKILLQNQKNKNCPFAAAWNLGELPRTRGLGPHPRREEEPPAPAPPRPEHDEVF